MDLGQSGAAVSATTLYASCGSELGTTLTSLAVFLSLARPASICRPLHVASVATGRVVQVLVRLRTQ